ncbi:MAG: hypothetical protein ACTTJV_02390 [Ottowia sp.]
MANLLGRKARQNKEKAHYKKTRPASGWRSVLRLAPPLAGGTMNAVFIEELLP